VLRRAPIGVVILDRDLQIERASRTAESDGPRTPADAGRLLFDAWSGVPDADRMVISAVTDDDGTVERIVWI
jgi:hypothetical protein